MWVSGRQAAAHLRDVLSSDEQVRLLLRTGIVASGPVVGGAHTYDEAEVVCLGLRPTVDPRELAHGCPHGVYVARLPRTAKLDLSRSWSGVADQVRVAMTGQRRLTPLSEVLTSVRTRAFGPLPFVATYLGYVVLTADLVRLADGGPVLEPPGAWAGVVDGRRLPTAPGGRPSYVWTPPP